MSVVLLTVDGLNAYYGNLHALWDFNVHIDKGEIVTLIGNNGAGKSTLLRSIVGLLKPRSGSIRYKDEELVGLPANNIVRRGITLSPEGRQVFGRLTVYENLRMGGYARPKSELDESYERVYELFPILKERIGQQAGTLSGGEQQMLAIGRALMSNPALLLLDEPSLGLAPVLTEKIFAMIEKIRSQGVSILLVEQNAMGALMIADRGYIIENGHIGFSGSSQEMLDNQIVQEMYLGGASI